MTIWIVAAAIGSLIALIVGTTVAKRAVDGEAGLVAGLIAGGIAGGLVIAANHYLVN